MLGARPHSIRCILKTAIDAAARYAAEEMAL